MTEPATYDYDNWLVTVDRALHDYVVAYINDEDTNVEMDFPDTREWSKQMPLAKNLIHFQQDDIQSPPMGFGIPGDDIYDDTDPTNPTNKHREASIHLINYDVGVWVSANNGGATTRKALVQKLHEMFTTNTGKQAFFDGTEGLWVVSFNGGQNEIDRVNDLPIWRAMNMQLIVRVVSRFAPGNPVVVPTNFGQGPHLTIRSEDGSDVPLT